MAVAIPPLRRTWNVRPLTVRAPPGLRMLSWYWPLASTGAAVRGTVKVSSVLETTVVGMAVSLR